MVDVTDNVVRAALASVEARAAQHAEAYDWALGRLTSPPVELLPPAQTLEGRMELQRIWRQSQTLGPRILDRIVWGTIGEVNWGGEGGEVDAALEALELGQLAQRLLVDLLVGGMAAAWAYVDARTGRPRVSRLSGYLQPLTDPDDVDRVVAIYQAWQSADVRQRHRWNVRIYDLEDATLREWLGVRSPTSLAAPPVEYPNITPPRYAMLHLGDDGLPQGPVAAALPVLKAELAQQMRIYRVAEQSAWPVLAIRGQINTAERGPSRVLQLSDTGGAEYLRPGDLSQLEGLHDRTLERLREDLSLPGGFLGRQTPSGEALREANLKFVQACSSYARLLSRLLTGVVADYAALAGVRNPPQVSVIVNREFDRSQRIADVLALYREGLIPLSVAVNEISVYMPTWSDEEVAAWIEKNERTVTPDDLARVLGGGGNA